jgi:hypothetical protein
MCDEEVGGAAESFDRLMRVVAVVPGGTVADRQHCYVAPHPVAAGDFDGQAGEGRQRVGEVRVGLAPDEGLHAAHRGAEDEAKMVDVQIVDEHLVLRADHVVVGVARELHAEAVRRLAGLAVADVVGEDDEIPGNVERLARAEEDVGEDGVEQGVSAAAGAVQQQDGIVSVALGVAVQRPEREVVEVHIGERLAGAEAEVMDVEASVRDGPVSRGVLRLRGLGGSSEGEGKEKTAGRLQHEVLLSVWTILWPSSTYTLLCDHGSLVAACDRPAYYNPPRGGLNDQPERCSWDFKEAPASRAALPVNFPTVPPPSLPSPLAALGLATSSASWSVHSAG